MVKNIWQKYGLDKCLAALVSCAFLGLMLIQYSKVWLYFDDFGYASLSYAYVMESVKGTQFTFFQLVEYLGHHYQNWGGRVVCFFLAIICYSKNIWFARIVMALVIWGIVTFTAYIAMKMTRGNALVSMIFSCCFYAGIGWKIVRDGMYWFTASFLYIVPLLPFLVTIWFFYTAINKKKEQHQPIWKWILLSLLAFATGASQEQISVVYLVTLFLCLIEFFIKNKKLPDWKYLGVPLAAVAGAVFLFAAPGNWIRVEKYAQASRLTDVFLRLKEINIDIFDPIGPVNLLICVCVLALALFTFKRFQLKWKIVSAVVGLMCICNIIYFFFAQRCFIMIVYDVFGSAIALVWTILFYMLFACLLALVCTAERQFLPLYFLLAALGSIAAIVIVSPFTGERVSAPFIVLQMPAVIYSVDKWFASTSKKTISCLVAIPLVFVMGINMLSIVRGYRGTNEVNWLNDQYLRAVSETVETIDMDEPIVLLKVGTIHYANGMPYMNGHWFVEYYMKEYYDLPLDVTFEWVEPTEEELSNMRFRLTALENQ